jgi:hypothetical protein
MIESDEMNAVSASRLRAELVSRARSLIPVLEMNAAQTEADRRVAERNITAIKQAKLFKIMVPGRLGGLETGPSLKSPENWQKAVVPRLGPHRS